MELHLRKADIKDLKILTKMNKELIEDEGSQNPMYMDELEQRMMNWLTIDWNIDILCLDSEIIGYALYQFRENQFFIERKEVY